MSLIDRFITNCYKVERMRAGTYVDGFYVPGCLEEIEIMGSLQPMNARELKQPEEADRLRQWFKFYSDKPVFTDNVRTLAKSDVVTINGDRYRVMSSEIWQGHLDLPYYMAIMYREPETGQGRI